MRQLLSRVPPRRALFAIVLGLSLAAAWTVLFRVDFSPQVGADFFFSTDDPQLRASREIDRLFPSRPQVIVCAIADDLGSEAYLEDLRRLTEQLAGVEGVASVQSLTRGPRAPEAARESPLWRRLVLSSDPRISYLLVQLAEESETGDGPPPQGAVVAEIEAVIAEHRSPELELRLSGVPFVVERVRAHLERDLRVFTLAALVVFGLLVTLVYRSWRISLATLLCCLAACALTLAALHLSGTPIGLLSANIVTIVFVLTLSHVVFVTAAWRRLTVAESGEAGSGEAVGGPGSEGGAVARAARRTFVASFWCMVTTLLGFASLLLASARPLRELGLSGAVGAAAAIVAAYGLYPTFLATMPTPTVPAPAERPTRLRPPAWLRRRHGAWPAGVALLVVVCAFGLTRIDTDPALPAYFADGSPIREGLERIDRADGSSPLQLVVRAPDGGRLDREASLAKLEAAQEALSEDPSVGVALSLPVLLTEARRAPMAFLLGTEQLLALLESPAFDSVARSFLTAERDRAQVLLRMREQGRGEPRRAVIERLVAAVEAQGLEVETAGGLYDLQARLGALVASSLLTGLGGLFALFLVIAAVVSRSARTTAAMVASLAAVPVLVLGGLALAGEPLDVISSPAANVAIALGIDSMIHLVVAVRRQRSAGAEAGAAWRRAVEETWRPIFGAAFVLAAGFGLFAFSSFPPTRRFGLAVAVGTLAAAVVAAGVLPRLAAGREK